MANGDKFLACFWPIKIISSILIPPIEKYFFSSFVFILLLLNKCVNLVLTEKELRRALKQDLKDINGENNGISAQ